MEPCVRSARIQRGRAPRRVEMEMRRPLDKFYALDEQHTHGLDCGKMGCCSTHAAHAPRGRERDAHPQTEARARARDARRTTHDALQAPLAN
jgi:hypothetical protein